MSTVLIADDHAFFRAGLESALQGAGYDVVASVEDGESALNAVAKKAPDIVILDVRMPRLNGVATLKALRERAYAGPVVMLAAEFEDHVLAEAIRSGASAIIDKNGEQSKLFDALVAVMSGGKFIDAGYLERFVSASEGEPSRREPSTEAKLNRKERLIAEEVAKGLRNREIAAKHDLSEAMVKLYLHRIYARLGLANRTELALLVREGKLD